MTCTIIKRHEHYKKIDQEEEMQCTSRMTSDLDRSQGSVSSAVGDSSRRGERMAAES